ncbi:hypothetical protein T265_08455 [Opisthorchis viverrini]|uniref:Uncharacterized protein n=1 Tax=Opisthorchis viverrini TaxID=6198 RepID=A0A074Z947_OPIVI|nr:hypothetical protein T265_08455 [Opisthorchis viverrini]KER23731.1 hypothetical protein T265_08455 [Opisthorchis viverrini]
MTHRARLILHLSAAGAIRSGWWLSWPVPVPQISLAVSAAVTLNVQCARNVIIDNAYWARLSTVDWCGPCIRRRDCHISHFNIARLNLGTVRTPPVNSHFRIFPKGVFRAFLTQVKFPFEDRFRADTVGHYTYTCHKQLKVSFGGHCFMIVAGRSLHGFAKTYCPLLVMNEMKSLGLLNTTAVSLSPPVEMQPESEYVEAPVSSAVWLILWVLRLKIRYPEIRRTGSLRKIPTASAQTGK